MSGPWENYAPVASAEPKPWEKYATTSDSATPMALTAAPETKPLGALLGNTAISTLDAAKPLLPHADAAGEGLLGTIASGVSSLPLAMGGAAGLVGADSTRDNFFDSTTAFRQLGDKLHADANSRSAPAATLGSVAGILPMLAAPELLGANIVSGGTEPATHALDKGADLATAEKLMGIGTAVNAAANLLPAASSASPIVRALVGGATNAGAAYATPALEHAVAPQYVDAPTLQDVLTQGGIGAVLAAAVGHGAAPVARSADDSIRENLANVRFTAPGSEVPLGLPETTPINGEARTGFRPEAPASPGPVHVTPQGEAFTPAQGKSVLAEAIGNALHAAQAPGLPEPTVRVDAQGNALTTADQHAALQAKPTDDLATALGLTPGTLAAQANDPRTARPGAPIAPKGLPAPAIAVDQAGTAMTSADFMRQLKDAQAATEQRQALGLTPDVERAQAARVAGAAMRQADAKSKASPAAPAKAPVAEAPTPEAEPVFSFAGERAQTADRAALEQAQHMEAMGRDSVPDRFGNQPGSPEDTHIATGWHRGTDGKWRFEIDDSAARVDEDGLRIARQRSQPAHLGDVFHHPDLLAAYPDLADVRVRVVPGMKSYGAYSPSANTIDIRAPGEYRPSGDGSLRSVLLHEIQHAIQNHEGFARGGSPKEARTMPEFEQALRQHMAAHDGRLPSWTEVQPGPEQIEQEAAHQVYRRLAGEVEARNTQARLGMTAEERRATPPTETADVPRGDQIVRVNSGVGERKASSHDDARAIDAITRAIAERVGKHVTLAPAASVPDPLARALAEFGRAFGVRPIAFDNLTPDVLNFRGVTTRDGTIFINAASDAPLLGVAGHELLHQMRRDRQDLYDELEAEVRRQGRLDAYDAVLRDRARKSGTNPDMIGRGEATEELVADAVGDALTDPGFIESLAKRNPTLFRRVADYLLTGLRQVISKLRSLGSNPFLADVEAFRDKLADVLERYAEHKQGGQREEQAGEYPKPFAQQVRERLASGDDRGKMLDMGRTPAVLRMLGFDDLSLRMPPRVLFKLATGKGGERPLLTERQVAKLPEALDEPVAVLDSATVPGALVVVTSMKDGAGNPIMAAVHPNGRDGNVDVHVLTSAYGKNRADWLQEQAEAGRLRYLDKEKGSTTPEVSGLTLNSEAEPGRSNPSTKSVLGLDDLRNFRAGKRAAVAPPAEDEPSVLFSLMSHGDGVDIEAMPSRRPGESQDAYTRRVMRKNHDEVRAATELAKTQRKLGRYAIRAMNAQNARQLAIADASLSEARKTFDKTPDVINFASVHQWETGEPIADADFRAFAATMQAGFDQRIAKIQALAPGALQSLIEHYMPHLYEDSGKATKWYQNTLGKRPLEGDKSFLKQRTWPTLKEAMASGLKPITPNPVDWVLAKYHQMDKFIGMLELKQDLHQHGMLIKLEPGQRAPDGWAPVDDAAFRVAGGLQGHFAVPELVAKDLNNYLAPGLSRFGAWRTLRGAQNALVSANLGWSAFHAGFTSLDNAVTHGAVGLQRLVDGDVAGGLMALVKAVPTMLTSPFEGGKLNRAWTGQEQADPHTAAILDALTQGGARMKMSDATAEYNNALPKVLRTLRRLQAPGALPDRLDDLKRMLATEGPLRGGAKVALAPVKAAGTLFSAIGETGSFLIHHVLVPNQKMAARATLLKFELDRYAKQLGKKRGDYAGIISVMHPDVLRQLASDVVDKVDFRLGQMAYDNYFFPKIAREVAQALVMAPGWQAGAFQTMTGGVKDLGRLAKPEKLVAPLDKAGKITDAHRGRFTNNVANLAMLMLMVGGANALIQYALTGEGPDGLLDLVAPRTGRKNPDDTDERLTLPSYLKDHWEFTHHPLEMASHKLHPALRMLWDLAHNEDYFGNKIHNEHDPAATQVEQVAGYLLKGLLPLSAQNVQKAQANGDGAGTMAANFVGVTEAPASITRSPFQAFVAKGGAKGWDYPASTPQEAAYNAKLRAAEDSLRTGQEPDLTGITARDAARLQRKVRTPKPEAQFDRLGIEDMLDAYDLATPEERERYQLRQSILHHHPLRSAAFRRLDEGEQKAVLDRIAALAN